ncbi:MAG: BACON domain-containing protein, partial [Bacteroidaceae bacterium]
MVGLEVSGQSDPSMTFTPEGSLTFEAPGGELDVIVTTVNVSDWEISSVSEESWVKATRSGDQIHVKVEPNSTGSSRRATISVSSDDLEEDKTITVIQKEPTLDIGSDDRTIPATSTDSLTCDVYSNARWKVTSSDDWLQIVSPANGMGSGDRKIVLKPTGENTSTTKRVATVTITNRDYPQQSDSCTVTQLGANIILTLSTTSLLSSNTGGEQNFTITSNKDLDLTATDDATGGAPTWFRLDKYTLTASGVAAIEKGFKVTFDK